MRRIGAFFMVLVMLAVGPPVLAAGEDNRAPLACGAQLAIVQPALDLYVLQVHGEINECLALQASDFAWQVLVLRANGMAASRVIVEINSPGGSLFDSLSVAEQIRRLVAEGIPVVTHVRGLAASGAAVIFAAGSERLMSPGSMLMYHSLLYWTPEGYTWLPDGRRNLQANERINDRLIRLVAAWTSLPYAVVWDAFERERWLYAEEAITEGWATGLAP